MTGNEFACFDAIALADQIRRKKVSASEVLEASIASIDNLNPRLNAVILKLYGQARDQLSALNRESPLCGVPFLAKDLFAEIAGTPLHEGFALLVPVRRRMLKRPQGSWSAPDLLDLLRAAHGRVQHDPLVDAIRPVRMLKIDTHLT